MDRALIGRRAWLISSAAALAAWATPARAMGRIPIGNSLTMRLPHDTSRLDPHDLHDATAAIIGASVFDTVYATDAGGNSYATLADGMPAQDGAHTRVRLRDGLRSSRGKPMDARDLVASIDRARTMGASAILDYLPRPLIERKDFHTAVFRNVHSTTVARALCSPLAALVSRSSSPTRPDGTGAFQAEPSRDRLVLTRNKFAARGPAFLDQIVIMGASDMAQPLRDFESHSLDIGWLGSGLHQARSEAIAFDFGPCAWVVLRTGNDALTWNAPGVAQSLIDAIPPERLAHLALGTAPAPRGPSTWGGPPCELYVDLASAHLVEAARALASILSSPGHEVSASPIARDDLARRRASRAFALMIDVVRPVGPPGIATLISLATADSIPHAKALMAHPPKLATFSPRVLTRTLRLGLLGELRIAGACGPGIMIGLSADGAGWNLASAYRLAVP